MNARDEPSYLAFSRMNVRDGLTSSATVVRELVARIDRDAAALKAAQPRTIRTHQERATLKPGTICMDLAGNAWKRGTGSWVGTGEGGPLYDEENLTMVVLHEPEATA